jgi:hypothetical protein
MVAVMNDRTDVVSALVVAGAYVNHVYINVNMSGSQWHDCPAACRPEQAP